MRPPPVASICHSFVPAKSLCPRLLVAAERDALDRVRPVLETLGTVRRADDASTAAALKLIANSSLAGAVLALRDSLRQADALGLPRTQALDVLELGRLGGLVVRKRRFLLGEPTAATAATATMTLSHGADTFTDIFLLVRAGDRWRIANKVYHRHP